ncbi:MAG: hypothetical protein BGN86_02100 [Caulobacterales bacterium 68-7]|nr:MAG: hypothetical protein BGN86_02100 [Caulobacterales bacterium 68-7]
MRNHTKSKASVLAVAALVSSLTVGGATVATTGVANAGVTSCNSTGGRQEAGALIGALIGGVVGNQVAKNERGLGTALGLGLGAAAGSAIGCKQQDDRAEREQAYYRDAYRASNTFVARSNVNIRSGPSVRAARVGSLGYGETFQSMGATRDGQWVLVGRNGYRVGYVAADYVAPAGYQHAAYVR